MVIVDVVSFAKWFAGVNRRAIRDISALPEEAFDWRPGVGEGEQSWSIAELVSHMASSRLYFLSAYSGQGWVWDEWPSQPASRGQAIEAFEASGTELTAALERSPNEWLERKIPLLDDPDRSISGWRVLMMMAEHDVHHRSQIDTYAGVNGWPVVHIFERTAEYVLSKRDEQISRYRGAPLQQDA